MPRILLAPDKFKGSLSAAQVAGHLEAGLRSVRPDVTVTVSPVADGGDGTVAAAVAVGFERVPVRVTGPTGMPRVTAYARRDDDAVVELADASGLAALPGGQTDPMGASSRGAGEVIAAALDAGCRRVVVGIGGSASTDGGAGLLAGLGARVLDASGSQLADGGGALAQVARLDLANLHPGVQDAEIVVACDVDNPLTGERGAAAVYGPQKGASARDVDALDMALTRWADVVAQATGADHRDDEGAGAAGGVGFGLVAVAGGTLRPGADLVFELTGLVGALEGIDLVITGEGSLDEQTLNGKGPAAVAHLARDRGIPLIAVAGQVSLDHETLSNNGFRAAYALVDEAAEPSDSFTKTGELLERIGSRIAQSHLEEPT